LESFDIGLDFGGYIKGRFLNLQTNTIPVRRKGASHPSKPYSLWTFNFREITKYEVKIQVICKGFKCYMRFQVTASCGEAAFSGGFLFYAQGLNWLNFTYSFGDETVDAIGTADELIAHLRVILF